MHCTLGSDYSEPLSCQEEVAVEEASQVREEVVVVHLPSLAVVVEEVGEACLGRKAMVGVEAFQAREVGEVVVVVGECQTLQVVEEEAGEEAAAEEEKRHTAAFGWMLCFYLACLHPGDPDQSEQPCPPSLPVHPLHGDFHCVSL